MKLKDVPGGNKKSARPPPIAPKTEYNTGFTGIVNISVKP